MGNGHVGIHDFSSHIHHIVVIVILVIYQNLLVWLVKRNNFTCEFLINNYSFDIKIQGIQRYVILGIKRVDSHCNPERSSL